MSQATLPSTKTTNKNTSPAQINLHNFNPNSITKDEAMGLGFSNKLATTLINYRNKGGKYYKKEDLKKLYGMSNKQYAVLEQYIVIAEQQVFTKPIAIHLKPVLLLIELNTTDTAQLIQLKGIGPVFSKRILKFRDVLGGFYDKKQLLEVYGMTDSLYKQLEEKITINTSLIKQLSINQASEIDLSKHPYIKKKLASIIVNYRNKHGLYKTSNDLLKTGFISKDIIDKLLPYISF